MKDEVKSKEGNVNKIKSEISRNSRTNYSSAAQAEDKSAIRHDSHHTGIYIFHQFVYGFAPFIIIERLYLIVPK